MPDSETRRLRAGEIFERVSEDAHEELRRPTGSLASSGLFAGLTMGLSALGVAGAMRILGDAGGAEFVAYLLYPIGFLAVILGRAQLFTENTLYPVVLVLDQRRYLAATGRLWAVVLASNLIGVALFALLATRSGAIDARYVDEIATLGVQAVEGSYGGTFWSAVVGGWMIALVAWLVSASQWTVGQFLVIYAVTFLVGLGKFDHCIVSATEALAAVI